MTRMIPVGDDCFVVSDLHLAEGNLDRGRTLGTENFFSDGVFSEMLQHLESSYHQKKSQPCCLIINGDFVDFIRITRIPETKEQFHSWQNELNKLDPQFIIPSSCISGREKKYGLRTNNYKSVWKLYCAILGHPVLFEALSQWISSGNQLIINVGNHDPEWYWKWVQDYLKIRLWEMAGKQSQLQASFQNNILFSIAAFSLYDKVWIDHGHNYEKVTCMDPDYEYDLVAPKQKLFSKRKPQIVKKEFEKELFISFGSFLNRYLINRVEFDFPHVDNLSIKGSMFRALLDENFEKVIKIFANFGWYAVLVVKKNFQLSIIRFLIWLVFVLAPIIMFVYLFSNPPTELFIKTKSLNSFWKLILNGFTNLFIPLLSRWALKKILLWLKLTDPPLSESAFKDLGKGGKLSVYDYIVLGHNHHPQHIIKDGKEYLNSGTWTSKYVQKYERIESGVTYNLVYLSRSSTGSIHTCLMSWNTDNKKLEPYSNFITNA